MTRNLLNEAERFLLQHWEDARLLEESMATVRTKYKELFQRVVDVVTEAHPELDVHVWYATQSWTNGAIGFGRTSWPGSDADVPSGLWIENLKLEILAAEHSEPPIATIYVAKRFGIDMRAARAAITAEMKRILGEGERESVRAATEEWDLLEFVAPSKNALLTALADGDGQQFVDLLRSPFDLMARFIPSLDNVFQGHMQAKKI